MKSKTRNSLFSKVDLSRREFMKWTCAIGLEAVSAPLLIGRWAQPTIAAVAIGNFNVIMDWHSQCDLTTDEAGVCSGGNIL